MTVAEIQEYIVERKATIHTEPKWEFTSPEVEQELEKILSMLDELEERPKAKWKHDKWKYRNICSNCGSEIFEELQPPYCSNCGAIMNDRE